MQKHTFLTRLAALESRSALVEQQLKFLGGRLDRFGQVLHGLSSLELNLPQEWSLLDEAMYLYFAHTVQAKYGSPLTTIAAATNQDSIFDPSQDIPSLILERKWQG